MSTLAMRILTVLGVLMSLGWWAWAPAARASEADSYWMCKTSTPVGWCPTSSTNPLPVIGSPGSSGGLAWYFVQPAASDNHAVVKAGAGQVYHVSATNNSATVNYLRLYDATTGFNGCNSATNLIAQWAIPASTSGAGFVADVSAGIVFSTGISICVSSGYATTDTTNATASAMSVNIGYK